MGKKKEKKDKKEKHYPFVSVCTPTYNRRPFIPIMFECFKNQTYPKHRIEWIIIDDGTDKIKDLIDEANIPQIKYFAIEEKMTLGKKRNYMHEKSSGSYIVYMDDDDYYPPDRISHAVERLQKNPKALCAGSSELYIYFKHLPKMYQCGPYGPNHSTAGTFAFRKELLNITKYNEEACLAEEKEFLHNYTIPFVQLDPLKTILVFSHNHNTFDKKRLLENPNPQFTKPSEKTVDQFIRFDYEKNIKEFFMEKIDPLLEEYAPGAPDMKPDVLKQTKEIEEERKKMQQQGQQKTFMVQQGDKQVPLTLELATQIITNLQKQLAEIKEKEKKFMVQQGDKQVPLTLELATQLMGNMQNTINEKDKLIQELMSKP